MARSPKADADDKRSEAPQDERRIRSPTGANAEKCMIRVNLPPDLHRRLWEMRIETRQSIQQIVTDILAEKLRTK